MGTLRYVGGIASNSDAPAQGFYAGGNTPGVGDVARFVAVEAVTAHAHYAFIDSSTIAMASGGAGVGHASFGCFVVVSGTVSWDHHHAFQDSSTIGGSGTLTWVRGFYTNPTISAPVTSVAGFHAVKPLGAGVIGTYYGFYADGDPTRATTNYAFFSSGSAPSFLGGALTVAQGGLTVGTGGITATVGDIVASSGVMTMNNPLAAANFRLAFQASRGGAVRWAHGFNSSDEYVLLNAALGAANLKVTDLGALTVRAGITHGSATLLTTTVALTNGAAAAAGTLTNAPVAGNPTKWVPINDNGTTRYIPAW